MVWFCVLAGVVTGFGAGAAREKIPEQRSFRGSEGISPLTHTLSCCFRVGDYWSERLGAHAMKFLQVLDSAKFCGSAAVKFLCENCGAF